MPLVPNVPYGYSLKEWIYHKLLWPLLERLDRKVPAASPYQRNIQEIKALFFHIRLAPEALLLLVLPQPDLLDKTESNNGKYFIPILT